MGARDHWGLAVTASDEATIAAIGAFSHGLLTFDPKVVGILDAARADPGAPLASAYAAMLMMFAEAPAAPSLAAPFLSAADAAGGTARERALTGSIRAWAEDDAPRAAAICEEILADHPGDLVAAKLAQYHHFGLGDAAGMLRAGRSAAGARPDAAEALGLRSFGEEECHLLREAEDTAQRALALDRGEAWSHHTLAHVMLTEGRIGEGRAFLADVAETWAGRNSFLTTHNWWHAALFMISEGDFAAALAAYDNRVWGVEPEYSQDQAGAVALLTRLEIAGADPAERWADLGARLAARAEDTVSPFLTMHYLYGLARAGRPEAETLRAAVRRRAQSGPESARAVWREAAAPACDGLAAHAAGDWAAAARCLGRAAPELWRCGGSHAQRDLFAQIRLDALIRAGHLVEAQQLLELRRVHEPEGRVVNRLLAGVYRDLGLPAEAARALARL